MTIIEARLVRSWLVRLAVAGFFSCGLLTLLMYLKSRRFPRTLDPQGITLRNGGRLAWADLTTVKPVYVRSIGSPGILSHVVLRFGADEAGIYPRLLDNGAEVLAFIREITRHALPIKRGRA